ncbi:MAG: cyclopropane-fatty-acyl-phospholipid synthase family protein [Acidimicrobiia bacterium]|nr:cyclopropane-fatty-acyl-phospholipid synthase family protein [Acidimicrobiia bacterium]MDH5504211.1 cyclopropane-fatty-acyl-phospholipid synthase family protein [Acidimicrobiia bacterium]
MDSRTVTTTIWNHLTGDGHAPQLRLWDGSLVGPSAPATVVLNHPGALRALALPPSDLTAGEAYIYGDVDFEGDLVWLSGFAASLDSFSSADRRNLFRMLRKLPRDARRRNSERPKTRGVSHSIARDRSAIQHHYDVGNDFYSLFLDESMVYSCAYFLDEDEPLGNAQRRKLDLVCRKLGLRKGDRFLDVGCGWGALVVHAAERYGVQATGITLSSEQAAYARDLARRRGLGARVEILEIDYRELSGTYEAVASVGMFEHVGKAKLDTYFQALAERVAPGGVLLNHGIATRDRYPARLRPSFVRTYVFPDGELLPVDVVIGAAEDAGFEMRDAESLRRHYGITLRHWVANLERHETAAVDLVGELKYRIWRLYMAGSAAAFESAAISVYQLLLTKTDRAWRFGRAQFLARDDALRPELIDLRDAEHTYRLLST